jgi:transposase
MDSTNEANRPQIPPSASTSYSTRDQRLQIQTLRDIGLTYRQIHEQLGLTHRQIRYAISHRVTPKKRSGRPSILTQEEVNEIITWICFSKANRRTPWVKIPIILKLNVSYYYIRTALRNAGFARRVARRKPPLSERNRIQRLQ